MRVRVYWTGKIKLGRSVEHWIIEFHNAPIRFAAADWKILINIPRSRGMVRKYDHLILHYPFCTYRRSISWYFQSKNNFGNKFDKKCRTKRTRVKADLNENREKCIRKAKNRPQRINTKRWRQYREKNFITVIRKRKYNIDLRTYVLTSTYK